MQYVKGEYFAYLDGDDFYIDDHKLQKQVEIMDQPENAKYAVCAHNVYAYDEKTKENTPFLNCNHTMKLKGTTYWGRFYFHPDSILMRSAYIKDIPMDVVADYLMIIPLRSVLSSMGMYIICRILWRAIVRQETASGREIPGLSTILEI